jgi:heavy metal sensor kinase
LIVRSFRTRLMAMTAGLSGAVLAAFGVTVWLVSYRVGLEQVDRQLRDVARREVAAPRGPGWRGGPEGPRREPFDPQRRGLNATNQPPHAFVTRPRGERDPDYRSPVWPQDISVWGLADPPIPPGPALPPPDMEAPPRLGPPSDRDPQPGPGGRASFPPLPVGFGAPMTRASTSGLWRVMAAGNRQRTIVVGLPLKPLQDDLRRLARTLGLALGPGLLLIAAGSWLMARRALRPVAALTAAAEAVTAHGLDRRLDVPGADAEFARLIEVYNRMLERLERSFRQATRFSADAAHELKTPLAILQGQLEEALRDAGNDPERQRHAAELLEEVLRLKAIVRKLLLLATADAGQLQPHREVLDLAELVEEAAEDARALAPGLEIRLTTGEPVRVAADRDLVGQVLQNLAVNAVKYNREGGFVAIALTREDRVVRLEVTNSGPPIPPDAQARVFERFFRADPSRARTVEGVGLGLSLAREIARAHGGDLVLARSDENGTTFVLTLPVA